MNKDGFGSSSGVGWPPFEGWMGDSARVRVVRVDTRYEPHLGIGS